MAKTNFSFDIQYLAQSTAEQAQRDKVMGALQSSLQTLFTASDSGAKVVVSDSHKGSGNRIAEITTSLDDARIAELLQGFAGQNGVSVSALE